MNDVVYITVSFTVPIATVSSIEPGMTVLVVSSESALFQYTVTTGTMNDNYTRPWYSEDCSTRYQVPCTATLLQVWIVQLPYCSTVAPRSSVHEFG